MTPYEAVEKLIDKYGVRDVLIMITDVMHEKAEHIDINWQDLDLAREWTKAANLISKTVSNLPKIPGIK
jgi:hypothetical protein